MQKTLGFINERLYSDVKSWEVFEEDGKVFAVPVRKEVGDVEPDFHPGGFIGFVSNQAEVWRNGVVVRDGEPFEVTLRNGVYGYTTKVVENFRSDDEHLDYVTKMLEEKGYKFEIRKHPIHAELFNVVAWRPTKTGKIRRRWIKLGELEKHCDWFYDYNF